VPDPRPWWRPFRTALRVCIHLTAHLLIALWYVALIEIADFFLSLAISVHDIRFLDTWTIRDIFDAADLVIFAVFIGRGAWTAFRLLGEDHE
jgi:hypothetical protein